MDNTKGNILIYQNEKGNTKVDAYFDDSKIWMSQRSIAELYQKTSQNITYILRIYMKIMNSRKIELVRITYKFNRKESGSYKGKLKYNNLQMILGIGYWVRNNVVHTLEIGNLQWHTVAKLIAERADAAIDNMG